MLIHHRRRRYGKTSATEKWMSVFVIFLALALVAMAAAHLIHQLALLDSQVLVK